VVGGYGLATRGETPRSLAPAPAAISVQPAPIPEGAPARPGIAATTRPEGRAGAPSETVPAASVVGSPAASPARPALSTEIELIDEARRALDEGDPQRARSLLDRYAREAPRGQLAREAARLRAEANAAIASAQAIDAGTIP
jgi:hypothetical protein